MKLRKIEKRGATKWQLQWFEDGKRIRRFFDNEKDGKTFAAKHRKERSSLGESWAMVADRDRSEMMAALDRAKLGDYSLMEACEFFERNRSKSSTIRKQIADALGEYVVAKRAQNLKAFSLGLTEASLEKFSESFIGLVVESVSQADLEVYLAKRGGSPKSRKNWIGELSAFFDWSKGRGYCVENPCERIPRPIITRGTPQILAVEQVSKLLKATSEHDPKLVPVVALCLFAGLRTGEARLMTWDKINLSAGHLTVSEEIAKTRRRRIVPISKNLKAWLELGGDLPLGRVDDRITSARKSAGIDSWPRNVMRHSFCSYHLAMHGSAAQTALAAGHSETMLFTHYRELVTPTAAKAFFGIRPSS